MLRCIGWVANYNAAKQCFAVPLRRAMSRKTSELQSQTLATRLLRNRWYLKVIHQPQQSDDIAQILKKRIIIFPTNSAMRQKSSQLGISGRLFVNIATMFVKEALRGRVPRCNAKKILPSKDVDAIVASIDQTILAAFYEFAESRLPNTSQKRFCELRRAGNMLLVSQHYSEARKLYRRIHLHIGLPNANKIETIMKLFSEANSGIFCGATSRAARDLFDRIKDKGVSCSLETDQMRHDVTNEIHFASTTVENHSLTKTVEVAVVDEIQQIGNLHHGWAWTRTLLGVSAQELHLFGDMTVIPLIRRICETLDEPLYIQQHQSNIPINIVNESLNKDWGTAKKRDCIMAFSRREAFFIKDEIERKTNMRCAVAYDGLPVEIQARQVDAFNDPDDNTDVLILSNADILDMDIRMSRLVFPSTVKKLYQSKLPSVLLQNVASQAGKFGRFEPSPSVTMLNKGDMPFVKHIYLAQPEYIKHAGLRPSANALKILDQQLPGISFAELLQRFEDMATTNDNYFLCDLSQMKATANFIQHVDMTVHDRYQFVTSPITLGDTNSVEAIQTFAKTFGEKKTCDLLRVADLPDNPPNSLKGLNDLESAHRVIVLYMWLSLRYPDTFVTQSSVALHMKKRCEDLLSETLRHFLPVITKEMKPPTRTTNQDKDRLLLKVLEMMNQQTPPITNS